MPWLALTRSDWLKNAFQHGFVWVAVAGISEIQWPCPRLVSKGNVWSFMFKIIVRLMKQHNWFIDKYLFYHHHQSLWLLHVSVARAFTKCLPLGNEINSVSKHPWGSCQVVQCDCLKGAAAERRRFLTGHIELLDRPLNLSTHWHQPLKDLTEKQSATSKRPSVPF